MHITSVRILLIGNVLFRTDVPLLNIMSFHNEERELAIKLAELQAEVKICLITGLEFLAVFLAIAVTLGQVIPRVPAQHVIVGNLTIGAWLFSVVAAFFTSGFFISKATYAKRQMEKLRKQYIW